MVHKNSDDAFINSAYLSELWASMDLLRCKKSGYNWSDEREVQLQDEIRHSNILLNSLKSQTKVLVKNLNYSMQERLYKQRVNLSQSANIGEVSHVHDVTERRAVWIYKTYLKMGNNPIYKVAVTEILADEKNHFAVNKKEAHPIRSLYAEHVRNIDYSIFKNILPAKYGQQLFSSQNFWVDYYSGAKNEFKEDATIESFSGYLEELP